MKKSSLATLIVAAAIASGCGARTSEDDLLDFSRPVQTGGEAGVTGGTGGEVGVGGTGGVATTGGSGGFVENECCATSDLPGCVDPEVEACVCGVDAFCCNSQWDQACVDRAEQSCRVSCFTGTGGVSPTGGAGGMPPTGGTGGMPPTGGTGGVEPTGGTGGVEPTGGTGGVEPTGGAGGSPPGGDCCSSHTGQGCQVIPVQQCVCSQDPYCCNNQWDQLCADRAPACGADCEMGSGGMGTGGASTGGTGGMSTGGSGTGGAGTETCQSLFPGSCGSCLCTKCFNQLTKCLNDKGCGPLLACTITNQCACDGFF